MPAPWKKVDEYTALTATHPVRNKDYQRNILQMLLSLTFYNKARFGNFVTPV